MGEKTKSLTELFCSCLVIVCDIIDMIDWLVGPRRTLCIVWGSIVLRFVTVHF